MPATNQWAVSTLIREVLADPDLAHDDVFRRLLQAGLQDLVDAEAAAVIGAQRYERTPQRTNRRNGKRLKTVATTAGEVVDRPGFCGGLVMPWRVPRRWWCGCDGSGVRRRRVRGRRGWRGGVGCGCTSSPTGRWRSRGSSRSFQGPSRQNGPRACRGLPRASAAAPA